MIPMPTEKETPIEMELRVLYEILEKKDSLIFIGSLVTGLVGLVIGIFIGINIG